MINLNLTLLPLNLGVITLNVRMHFQAHICIIQQRASIYCSCNSDLEKECHTSLHQSGFSNSECDYSLVV